MVKPINKEYTLAAANGAWYADNATGATITLANNDSPDGQAYKVAVLNNGGNNLNGINFTITGLDQDGKAQSEVLAGPGGSATVLSVYYYSYISSITVSSTLGVNTIDIGTTTQFSTPTIPTDYGSIGSNIAVNFSGTMNYTVEGTDDNIQKKAPPFYWLPVGSPLTTATASQYAVNLQAPRALRTIVASYSGTPTFQFSILQASNRG
jgi:hypothetical protein